MAQFLRTLRRRSAALVASALVIGLLPAVSVLGGSDTASAASGSEFTAGNIISDAAFYRPDDMTPGEIQSFLSSKVPVCASGYDCLKDHHETTAYRAPVTGCSAYGGASNESAAAIIWSVGHVCGISPKVLIVLLEKEQALVSDSSPSSRQYRSATGYGCPDTAACDTKYYGFFNQLYTAAAQFRRYQAKPTSFGYVAGRWNTIQWNPNAACGSSQVFISNQATAGLYNYTPYRPNAAALANMYGLGDGCSAYGNRNFFRIYSDWFGASSAGPDFARTASDPTLYLLSGAVKYRVPSMSVYDALAPLSGYRVVTAETLGTYATSSKIASPLVRNPVTGDVSLIQSRSSHRFGSCDLVAEFGFGCAGAIDLTPTQLGRIPISGGMANAFVIAGSPDVSTVIDGFRHPLYDWAAVQAFTGESSPFIATMEQSAADRYSAGPILLAPRSLVVAPNDPTVFFVDGTTTLVPVRSFATAAEYGSLGWNRVPVDILSGYRTSSQSLSIVATCSSSTVVAGQGRLATWSTPSDTGLTVTPLSDDTCARSARGGAFSGGLFLKSSSDPQVYKISGGRKTVVTSWSGLLGLNGGTAPSIQTLSAAALDDIPDAVPASGSVVRTRDDARVFVVVERTLIAVESLVTTAESGLPAVRYLSKGALDGLATTGPSFTRQVSCSGTTAFAVGGVRVALSDPESTGVRTVTGSAALCAILPVAGAIVSKLFVRTPADPTVYLVTGGQRHAVATMAQLIALNDGNAPTVLVSGSAGLSDLPEGAAA